MPEPTFVRPERPTVTPLSALAEAIGAAVADGTPDPVITGLTLSTERVRPGDLYAALPGTRAHGAHYAGAAVAGGAVAVLTDERGAVDARTTGVPVAVLADPRAVLGDLAARVYGHPADALTLLGVTGTQGKTTTVRLLEGALTAAGVPAAAVGTVGTRVNGTELPSELTTPEAPDLHALFAVMRERGTRVAAVEVSSHALVLGRVDGFRFDAAAFLNLGRDHLDFHADLEDYFAAKATLFTRERTRRGLANVDDEHGRRLLDLASTPMATFSASGDEAHWRADDRRPRADGTDFTVVGPGTRVEVRLRLTGDFNVDNALAAVALAAEGGLDPAQVAAGLAEVTGVPGRFESIDAGQDFVVLVDYAHKPDALAAALAAVRSRTRGRIVLVVGAGGDRDPGKRPLMGEVGARLADVLVVTDDNPRSEEPARIRAAILAGATGPAEVCEIGDRTAAIRHAIGSARPGDVVLIAGKGHERGQEIGDRVLPFDDREQARAALAEQTGRPAG